MGWDVFTRQASAVPHTKIRKKYEKVTDPEFTENWKPLQRREVSSRSLRYQQYSIVIINRYQQ